MEQILMLLKKLENLSQNVAPFTRIEKDIMLQYTRDIYEAILQKETTQAEAFPTEIEAMINMVVNEIEPSSDSKKEEESEVLALEIEKEIDIEEEEDRWIVEDELELDTDVDMFILHETEEDEEQSNNVTELQTDEEEDSSNEDLVNEDLVNEDVKETTLFETITDFKVWNKDIRTYIGINDKYNFISELFGNNAEAYDEILNEINLCERKKDALVFLENSGITTLYSWKEDGFSEQIFYNVLSQFFSSR